MPQGALAAHVGDSRIYRLRGNTISQLTFDHSLQWELQASRPDAGRGRHLGGRAEERDHRSLGPNPNVQIDLEGPHPIALGDVYLLCSDGLTGRVEDEEIGAILASLPPQEAAQALVDLANLRGGPDNVTVLIGQGHGPELVTGGHGARAAADGQLAAAAAAAHPAIWIVALRLRPGGGGHGGHGPDSGGRDRPGRAAAGGIVGAGSSAMRSAAAQRSAAERMLGRGPYTNVACAPSHELVQKLGRTLDELREAARDGEWTINWQPLDESCRQAAGRRRGRRTSPKPCVITAAPSRT